MAARAWSVVLAVSAWGLFASLTLGMLGYLWFPLDILAHFRVQVGVLAALTALLAAVFAYWRTAAVSVIAAAGVAFSLGPAWEDGLTPPTPSCSTVPLRVATANLLYLNTMPEAAIDVLLGLDGDVLATLETTPRFSDGSSRLHRLYPHVSLSPGRDSRLFYAVLWSKRPFIRSRDGGGGDAAPDFARGDIDLGDGLMLTIAGLHFSWPLMLQEPQLGGLERVFTGAAPRRIAMGDFNAAPWSEALRRAEDASETRLIGGLRLTWSGNVPPGIPMPPGLPLDHVLVSRGIGVERVEAVRLHGSDHKAVVADLRIPTC